MELHPGQRVQIVTMPTADLTESYRGMRGTVRRKVHLKRSTWEVLLDNGESGTFWPEDLVELSLLDRIAEEAE